MAKSSGLAVLAFLIAIGALGFGIYQMFFAAPTEEESNIANIWYQYDENEYFSISPIITHYPIPNMSIVFNLQSSVSLHLLFTCSVRVIPTTAYVTAQFHFIVDGTWIPYPFTRVGRFKGDTSSYDYYSVVLQHFYDVFPAGTHNITVTVYGESANVLVRECALCIQSYPI